MNNLNNDDDLLGKMITITNRFIIGFELVGILVLIWIVWNISQDKF